jgi:hypothetical protein
MRKARPLRSFGASLLAAAVLATAAADARAATVPSASVYNAGCPAQILVQPFAPWADVLRYFLAPNGGFESGPTGWKLTGGATVGPGNESFFVRSGADQYSLSLPSGSSATSSAVCIGTTDAAFRLFVQNTGSPLSTLKVDVVYTSFLGLPVSTPAGIIAGGSLWQPALPQLFLANVTALPLLTGGSTWVSLRFTPTGTAGSWRIDDLYVDPFKGV